mmetsp:Transcript_25316/g.76240  ORF Transcript_25316/g.76240 Transcript_25316/m.76240 type:complete len:818 (-) Transcript_25316:3221-5674(-)
MAFNAADGALTEPLLDRDDALESVAAAAPADLRVDVGLIGRSSTIGLTVPKSADVSGGGPRRRTLSGSSPLRHRHVAKETTPEDAAAHSDDGRGGFDGGSPPSHSSTVSDAELWTFPRRVDFALWCYRALEGGYAMVPLAWWFPWTYRTFSKPSMLIVLYIMTVAFPLFSMLFVVYGFHDKQACATGTCGELLGVPPKPNADGCIVVEGHGTIPSVASCTYSALYLANNSSASISAVCRSRSPLSSQPLIYEGNSTITAAISVGSLLRRTTFPSLSCTYICDARMCPGLYYVELVGLGTLLLVAAALCALRVIHKITVQRATIEPLSIRKLMRKLTAGLPIGTFMVSYSWGSWKGEQCSASIVAEIADMLPSCWWDKEQLLPGASVTEMCTAAASGCSYAFVFVSFSYLRSAICQTELEILREKSGRIIAAVHSDVAKTPEGKELIIELEAEGHVVYIVQPMGSDGSLSHILYGAAMAMTKPLRTMCGYSDGASSSGESFVFRVGEQWVRPNEFLWIVLCTHDVLLHVFKICSPPLNAAGWKPTAIVLRGSLDQRKRVWWDVMTLFWPVTAIIFAGVWGINKAESTALYVYIVAGSILWSIFVLIRVSRMVFATSISAINPAVLRRAEQFPSAVPDHRVWERAMPPSGGLLTILHRTAIVKSNLKDSFSTSQPKWPLKSGLQAPPIPVDMGVGCMTKYMHPLVAAGIVEIVPLGSPSAELRLVKLEAGVPYIEPASTCFEQTELFWSECGFCDLAPETQEQMSNRIVMVNTPGGPELETIIIQILIRKFHSDSSKIYPGSGKTPWRSKTLRAAYRRR